MTWFDYRQAETYQAVSTNDTHGKSGPLKISFAKSGCNVAEEFLAVAVAYDSQRGPIDDLNGFYACNGYGVSSSHTWEESGIADSNLNLALGKESRIWCFLFCSFSYLHYRFIDGKTGRRSDTASTYLYPLLETNKNLTLLPRKRVVRVIFEYISYLHLPTYAESSSGGNVQSGLNMSMMRRNMWMLHGLHWLLMLPAKSSFQLVLLDRLRSWKGEQQLLRGSFVLITLPILDLASVPQRYSARATSSSLLIFPVSERSSKVCPNSWSGLISLEMREQIITSISFNIMLQSMRRL